MIEAYAFLAAFVVQILVISILQPPWLIRHVRAMAKGFPAERFAQVYPGVDHNKILERYLKVYRLLNMGIVVLGVPLMYWLIGYLRRPDWDDGPVEALVAAYFFLQMAPILFAAWSEVRYKKLLESLLEGKRSAVLTRRGLFDFVSPITVFLSVSSYFLVVAYVLYIAQDPFPGFAGPFINIGMITLVYALQAFGVYALLYGRKFNPDVAHETRMRAIGLGVKVLVYASIANAVGTSVNFTLVRLDLQRWEPFAQSAFLVFIVFLIFLVFTASPRNPEAAGHSESPVS
jgi:hypothetical protein